jgi:predicted nucleic acid-binding protein
MVMMRELSRVAELFLDASYAIALSSQTDQHHTRALELAAWIEAKQIPLVTSRAVTLEIGNALAKSRYREAAVKLLSAIERDPRIEIVPFLYRQRTDKEWGLTDCISFVLMSKKGLQTAQECRHPCRLIRRRCGYSLRAS